MNSHSRLGLYRLFVRGALTGGYAVQLQTFKTVRSVCRTVYEILAASLANDVDPSRKGSYRHAAMGVV
jgi:hypothetical protein